MINVQPSAQMVFAVIVGLVAVSYSLIDRQLSWAHSCSVLTTRLDERLSSKPL